MFAEISIPFRAHKSSLDEGADRVSNSIGAGFLNPGMETDLVDRMLAVGRKSEPAILGGPNIVWRGKPMAVLENGAIIYESSSVRGVDTDEQFLTWLLCVPATAGLENAAKLAAWAGEKIGGRKTAGENLIDRWVRGEPLPKGLLAGVNALTLVSLLAGMASGGVPVSKRGDQPSLSPEHNGNWLPPAISALSVFLAACAQRLGFGETPPPPGVTMVPDRTPTPSPTITVAPVPTRTELSPTATIVAGAGGPEFLPGSLTELQSFIDSGRLLPFGQPISREEWRATVEQYGGEVAPLFNILKAQAEAQGLVVVENAGDLDAPNEVLMQVVVGEGWFIRIVGIDGMPYWVRTAADGKQFADHPNRIPSGVGWELAKIDVKLQSGQELKPVVLGGRPYEVVVGPGGKPMSVFNQAIEAGATSPLDSWIAVPSAERILADKGWGGLKGVDLLADGSLKIVALGGGSWNEPINRNLRITRENDGDFAVSANFALNPDYYHQGIILADSEIKNTGVRVDVSFIDGAGDNKWAIVEYWNKNTGSNPPRVLGDWQLADGEKLAYEMRLKFSGETMTIIIDGKEIGQVETVDLLEHNSIFLGFRTSPDESLGISDLSVMQRDGEGGIIVATPLPPEATAGTIFLSPTPGGAIPTGEAAATAVVPATPVIRPPAQSGGICWRDLNTREQWMNGTADPNNGYWTNEWVDRGSYKLCTTVSNRVTELDTRVNTVYVYSPSGGYAMEEISLSEFDAKKAGYPFRYSYTYKDENGKIDLLVFGYD